MKTSSWLRFSLGVLSFLCIVAIIMGIFLFVFGYFVPKVWFEYRVHQELVEAKRLEIHDVEGDIGPGKVVIIKNPRFSDKFLLRVIIDTASEEDGSGERYNFTGHLLLGDELTWVRCFWGHDLKKGYLQVLGP